MMRNKILFWLLAVTIVLGLSNVSCAVKGVTNTKNLTTYPEDGIFTLGDKLVLTCAASRKIVEDNIINLNFKVQHDGNVISSSSGSRDLDADDIGDYYDKVGLYEKENVTFADNGTYTCISYDDKIQQHWVSTTVYIADEFAAPTIVALVLNNNKAILQLNVNITPQTDYKIQWRVNGQLIGNNKKYTISGKNLEVNNFDEIDAKKKYSSDIWTKKAAKPKKANIKGRYYFVMPTKQDSQDCVKVFKPNDTGGHLIIKIQWTGVNNSNVIKHENEKAATSCITDDPNKMASFIIVTVGDLKPLNISYKDFFRDDHGNDPDSNYTAAIVGGSIGGGIIVIVAAAAGVGVYAYRKNKWCFKDRRNANASGMELKDTSHAEVTMLNGDGNAQQESEDQS